MENNTLFLQQFFWVSDGVGASTLPLRAHLYSKMLFIKCKIILINFRCSLLLQSIQCICAYNLGVRFWKYLFLRWTISASKLIPFHYGFFYIQPELK